MFKKKNILLFSLWILIVIGIVGLFSFTLNDNKESFMYLMNCHTENSGELNANQIKQSRVNVTKHFLRTKGNERFQLYLRSLSSDLLCTNLNGKSEVIEQFKNVTCLMQEELESRLSNEDSPLEKWQYIRQIDAENAVYDYHSENLLADEVKIARYMAIGHQLNSQLMPFVRLMDGTASKVELSLSKIDKPFKAQNIKAIFKDEDKRYGL